MIILGDISCPTSHHTKQLHLALRKAEKSFSGQNVVFNLEGLLSSDYTLLTENSPVVFNHPTVFEPFKKAGMTPIPMLANNHTLDLPSTFKFSFNFFKENQINFTGASYARLPPLDILKLQESNREVIVLNYCWDFLLYHQKSPTEGVHISIYDEKKLIIRVKELRSMCPEGYIMVYFHWNFDLEILPFPSHRSLAKKLIDCGVNLVVGCHSHCVQGGEKYKNGFIAYGLGNYFFPNKVYANGKLLFPDWASESLSLEVDVVNYKIYCHWFKGCGSKREYHLEYLGKSRFEDCKKMNKYSPYQAMGNQTYVGYFRKNRRKKLLIPIFKDHRDYTSNKIKLFFVKIRARISRKLASIGILNWQN